MVPLWIQAPLGMLWSPSVLSASTKQQGHKRSINTNTTHTHTHTLLTHTTNTHNKATRDQCQRYIKIHMASCSTANAIVIVYSTITTTANEQYKCVVKNAWVDGLVH